jgi:hypothetical protein
MNTETNRYEFEEWVITKLEYSVAKYKHSEEYLSDSVEVAWEAWQAAREQPTKQRDEWKAKYIQQNKDLGCEQMDPNGTIWDYAKKVQTDLASMTEQRDRLAVALQELRNNESMSLGGAAYEIVEQVLQSLTTNEQ